MTTPFPEISMNSAASFRDAWKGWSKAQRRFLIEGMSRAELTLECGALWVVLVHEFWTGDMTAINALIGATGLLVSYWGFRFGVLGVYVSGRTREKISLATGQETPGVLDKLVRAVAKKK